MFPAQRNKLFNKFKLVFVCPQFPPGYPAGFIVLAVSIIISCYNFSWNCGAEGATKKKKILKLRSRMRRNALILLFTSLGTPMLLAGDEFGNSQAGNNNAYCQDNETGWKPAHSPYSPDIPKSC